jgi:magnesium transporter
MLRAMSGTAPPADPADLAQAVWLDLCGPDEAERARVTQATGLRVPDRHEIAEIETSSRLVNEEGVLYLSTPMPSRSPDGTLTNEPIGFVVAPDRLLTVRFAASTVFEGFADHWRSKEEEGTVTGLQPFLGLLEALVDRLADVLEQIGADMDTLSAEVFARGADKQGSSRRRDQFLQATLAEIGRKGGRISQLRDGLLGIGRIVRFVMETETDWLSDTGRHRLATLERDVASLNDYDIQLTGKVQFLLDATLGFISIEQNNTIKVLTVVSIVGIPPTFFASLYGMNFHNMPELSWRYGYQYGLSLIALSILAPLLLFWRRGWL